MLFKKLFLITASAAVLGSAQAQSMQQEPSAPKDIEMTKPSTDIQNRVAPESVKKTVNNPVAKRKSVVKKSSKKLSKQHTHVKACDPKPEIVTCTMPTKP